jgi:hypothetical protein
MSVKRSNIEEVLETFAETNTYVDVQEIQLWSKRSYIFSNTIFYYVTRAISHLLNRLCSSDTKLDNDFELSIVYVLRYLLYPYVSDGYLILLRGCFYPR